MAVDRTLEIMSRAANKRTGDHPANPPRSPVENAAHRLAEREKPVQSEGLLVAGDLKHTVGRSVINGLARSQVFLPEAGQDVRAGSVDIPQRTSHTGLFGDGFQQGNRETLGDVGKITPLPEHRHSCDFPMTAGGVFPMTDFPGPTVASCEIRGWGQPFRPPSGGSCGGMTKTEGHQLGQPQWSRRGARSDRRNVPQCV